MLLVLFDCWICPVALKRVCATWYSKRRVTAAYPRLYVHMTTFFTQAQLVYTLLAVMQTPRLTTHTSAQWLTYAR
eukprot:2292766-Pleurochrysis_carterae.AAC.6